MTLLNRIRQYRVYRRMVLSYLLLIIMSITLVSTILYLLFSAKAVKEIDDSNMQMLSQVSFTANVVYKQIQDVMSQLLIDGNIDAFMSADEVDKITTYRAYLVISKVKSVYPFITNISLYNFVNNEYTDTAGLPRDPKVSTPAERQFLDFYPRKARKNEHIELPLLTFRIVKEWQPETSIPKSALVIDLNESYIQNTIAGISLSRKNVNTFVMDAAGQVLSHTDSAYFMADFSKVDYLQRILHAEGAQGSFVQTIDHRKHLVTYVRSSALDWFFVTIRPYNELLSDIYTLRNWTMTVAVLLILLGACASIFLTGNIYNPIRALVDRVSEKQGIGSVKDAPLSGDEYTLLSQAFSNTFERAKLQETIVARSQQIVRSSTIVSVLKGADRSALTRVEKEWAEHLKGPYFTVVLFKVDALQAFNETYSAIDRELIRFAIGNIAQELFGKVYHNDSAAIDDEVAVVLQGPRMANNDRLHLTLSEIQDTIQSYYKITVSVSIGDWCDSIAVLRHSYRSAQQYITYRLFFGRSCIVDASRIPQGSEAEKRYPSFRERKLIEAVKLCKDKAIQAEIDDWISFISHCSYDNAIQYTNFLFLAIIREFETITEWWELDTNHLYAGMYHIRHVETLDELRGLLAGFCARIVAALEENKHNVSLLKNERIIENVRMLIAEHYDDPNLSLEYASAHVGLSAGYLGKLFKSLVHSNYNDYVTFVRLDHAKRMLKETNVPIADIAAKAGIPGVPYFSTLFKKHVGMSPSHYRDNPGK